jgi:2-(1,2-epoxy-1,2-dihydrophenyl)acetyl-CoA isomerase
MELTMMGPDTTGVEVGGVRYERTDRVGRIVLERPDASNAFDLPAARALRAALDRVEEDAQRSHLGVVLVTAEGPRFCGGGDVRSFAAAEDQPGYLRELAETLEAELRRLSELPLPVVAAVQGSVAGAGLAFLLNSDVVLSARSTRFTMAYAGVGLTPDCGVSYLLPRAIGQQRALALALTGRVLGADEAAAWGLVTEVVDDEMLADRATALAESVAAGATGATAALGQAKRLIRSAWEVTRAQSAADEVDTIASAVTTPEAQARIERFVNR